MKVMVSNQNENVSWIDYIQKKYEIDNLDDIITLIYLSLLCSIIIYISFYFPVIHTAIIIFVVLCFAMFIIHRYYQLKYQKKVDFIREKLKDIQQNIDVIIQQKK